MALGSLIGAGFVRISADTDPGEKAVKALGAISRQALTSTLLPVVAPVVAAVGGIAASFLGAGVAAGAVAAAVVPQVRAVTAASQQYAAVTTAQSKADLAAAAAKKAATKDGVAYESALTTAATAQQRARGLAAGGSRDAAQAARDAAAATARAQSLATTGGKAYATALARQKTAQDQVKQAQDAYQATLAGLPPATRQTAVAFAGLTDAVHSWSDSLSGSTMPVFTIGIEKVQGLLPKLSPVVREASGEILSFEENIGAGTGGRVFSRFGTDIGGLVSGALSGALNIGRNLAVGFAGIMDAFVPMESTVVGGLDRLSGDFAEWGATAGSTSGVQKFFAAARTDGPKAVAILGVFATAAVHVGGGLGPLTGLGLTVLRAVAGIASALPVPVLNQVVNGIVAVNLAMKAYAIYAGAAAAATWLFSTANGASRVQMALLRAQMGLTWVQLRLQAAWSGTVTAAQWLWNTSLVATVVSLVSSTAALVARNVVLGASAIAVGIVTAATWLWTAALGPAIAAVWAMTAALLASPITWIVLGIGLLIAAIVLIATKTTWFQTAWRVSVNAIRAAFADVVGFLSHGLGQFALLILGPLAPLAFLALHWQAAWALLRTAGTSAYGFLDRWVIKPTATAFMSLWTAVFAPFIRALVSGFLDAALAIARTADDTLGWIPFVGSKLKQVLAAIDKFRDSVNASLGGSDPKPATVAVRFGSGPVQGTVTGHTYTSTNGYTYAQGGAVRRDGALGGARPSLPREERRELVSDLRDAGMSTRAIGSAAGVSDWTVRNDLSGSARNLAVADPVTNPFTAAVQAAVLLQGAFAARVAGRSRTTRAALLAGTWTARRSRSGGPSRTVGRRLHLVPDPAPAAMPGANGIDQYLSAVPPRSRARSGRTGSPAARAAGAVPAGKTVNLTIELNDVITSQRELHAALAAALDEAGRRVSA